MGYVKKEKVSYTPDGKPFTFIGVYKVVKNSEHMTGIYIHTNYGSRLVTSKPKWSQAIKIAKLLDEAYKDGQKDDISWG